MYILLLFLFFVVFFFLLLLVLVLLCSAARTLGKGGEGGGGRGTAVVCNLVAHVPVATQSLQVLVLVEESCGQNAGEWAGKAERRWKHRQTEGRKEDMGGKEEARGTF